MKENIIVQKSIDFALQIIDYSNKLNNRKQFIIANQLLRSGMSIGSNIHEAQHAESRSDFIHKIKIAAKEASETSYWLTICDRINEVEKPSKMIMELNQISAILGKILVTSKKNQKD